MLWINTLLLLQKAEEETVFFDSDPTKRIGKSSQVREVCPTYPSSYVIFGGTFTCASIAWDRLPASAPLLWAVLGGAGQLLPGTGIQLLPGMVFRACCGTCSMYSF